MLQSILFLLVIATVIFLRGKLRETPLARLSATHQSLIALGILVLLLLALTGKLGLLIPLFGAVAAAFIALVSRLMPLITPLLARYLPECSIISRAARSILKIRPKTKDKVLPHERHTSQ